MQLLSLIVSFFIGRYNKSHGPSFKDMAFEVLDEVAYKSRKPIAMIMGGLLGGLLMIMILCGGLFMTILDMTSQYDRTGYIQFSATLGTGLFLILATLGAFFAVYRSLGAKARHEKEEQKRMEEEHRTTPPPPAHGLEQALALLVMDFVKEREHKRDVKDQERAEYRQAVNPSMQPNMQTTSSAANSASPLRDESVPFYN